MRNTTSIFLISLVTVLLPLGAQAATVHLHADPQAVGVGDTVQVSVTVDTDAPLNTFSGTLTYSPSLTPVSVSDGNSIVNLWLTHPAPAPASSAFAGFTAGGYVGRGGQIFTILFKAKTAGQAQVALTNAQFLRNDGAGSTEPVTVTPLTLAIGTMPLGGFTAAKDTLGPEPFTPALGKDPALFDGKYYIAFSAVDKGTGVDHFTAAERRFPFFPAHFAETTSPRVLADQYLTSDVIIRGYDAAGNSTEVVFPRTHLLHPYEKALLGTILILILLWVLLRVRGRAR